MGCKFCNDMGDLFVSAIGDLLESNDWYMNYCPVCGTSLESQKDLNEPENAEIVAYSYFDDNGMPIKTIDLSMEISADFDKTMDAAYTLEHLKLRIRAYGFVNVTDLFNICALGIIKDPRGNFYGWTDLSDARYYTDVTNNRTTLKLPKPKFLGEGAKA